MNNEFLISFKNVSEDNTMLPTTRLLAVDITKNGYINVGDFFKNMPESDLQSYLHMVEEIHNENADAGAEVLLLSEMLAIGEGLENGLNATEMQPMQARMGQLIMFLSCESLARKGLVKLYRENMSFGDDIGNKPFVEKL
jgi:hypothetical protein